jgi:HTH-type transcriptional regulator/antitoxin HigA
MIKNQKQAGITKDRLNELVQAKTALEANSTMSGFERQLAENSINAMIEDLQRQLDTYEGLVRGNFHVLEPKSLKELPDVLIAARLALKLSQDALAKRLGMQAQQIQRYEVTDYETAAWPRIIEVSTALGIEFTFQKVNIINWDWDEKFILPDGMDLPSVNAAERKLYECKSLIC